MEKSRLASQSRQALDRRFKEIGPFSRFTPPVRGWIKAIREALGMSATQLATRMGVRQPTLVVLEQSEVKGTIQLATLRRVAEALNCTLVYALVPNKPLDTVVRDQARKVASRRLKSVEHTMLLENQQVPAADFDARLDELARDISPRTLWDES